MGLEDESTYIFLCSAAAVQWAREWRVHENMRHGKFVRFCCCCSSKYLCVLNSMNVKQRTRDRANNNSSSRSESHRICSFSSFENIYVLILMNNFFFFAQHVSMLQIVSWTAVAHCMHLQLLLRTCRRSVFCTIIQLIRWFYCSVLQ